jgi:hypothetical protein
VCPTEDKGCCPIEDKGCSSIEDKGYCPTEDKGCFLAEDKGFCPIEDKKTDQQTRTNNLGQTNTRTKTIHYDSNLGTIPDHSWPWAGYYNSCTLCRGLCPVPTRSNFIIFWWLENLQVAMMAKHNQTSFGVRPGDHYMPLQRFTLYSMICLAKVSPQRPLLHHAVYRYSHTLLRTTEQDTLPKANPN